MHSAPLDQATCRFSSATAVLALAAILMAAGLGSSALAQERDGLARPNVILIMTDDQGYGDVEAHGNDVLETPHLNRLYRESVRLTDFHVDPTCSPTRAALLTGRYSARTGVWHTIAGRSMLPPGEVTAAALFAEHGYRTALFGKWHLGDNYPFRPQDHGFQEVLIHGGGGIAQTPDYWGNDYFDDHYRHNGHLKPFGGYSTTVFFDHALHFIEGHRDRPFFLYLPLNIAHRPWEVLEPYAQRYRDKGIDDEHARFYGMLTHFDEQLGRLRKQLARWGLAENTILIFMSDNGSAAREGFNAGMRGRKGSVYEGGHRVPFFVHWPAGGVSGGVDRDELTAHIDVLPTLMALAGLQPANTLNLDGRSLAPLLRAPSEEAAAEWPRRTLFVHSVRMQRPEKWHRFAVMTERWRLVGRDELYDLRGDPGQRENVAPSYPEVADSLRRAYERWWASLASGFGPHPRIVLGTGHENPSRLTAHDWHNPTSTVPWNQSLIQKDPMQNGFWTVDVARAGAYHVTLRQRPAHVDAPLDAASARLQVGNETWTRAVQDGASEVRFEVSLSEGPARLQTWLTRADGASRGAYYVTVGHVEHLEPER